MVVSKAIVAKYPEVRDAFSAVIARAVDAGGHDYGSVLTDERCEVGSYFAACESETAILASAFLTSADVLAGRSNLHSSGFLSKRSP